MSALGNVISGKNGKVKEGGAAKAHITKWDLELSSNNPEYRSSSTGGATGRVAGHSDFKGSFEALVNTDAAFAFTRGAYYTLELHIDASGSNYYSCPTIIDSVKLADDIEGGGPIKVTCAFSANGDYTKNGTI